MSSTGCQTVSKARDMPREMSDLMSGIEDLHPLLGKQEKQVQCGVTLSESKLIIRNQAIGEEDFDLSSVSCWFYLTPFVSTSDVSNMLQNCPIMNV